MLTQANDSDGSLPNSSWLTSISVFVDAVEENWDIDYHYYFFKFFIVSSLTEVQLVDKKPHIINVYKLLSLHICIDLCYHHHNQGNKCTNHLQNELSMWKYLLCRSSDSTHSFWKIPFTLKPTVIIIFEC